MTRPALIALAAAAVGLAACGDARLRQPDLTLPSAFEPRAAAVDPAKSAASLDAWWTLFDDAQLKTLVEQALQSAPTARIAMARLEEAAATRRGRILQTLPQGNLTASATEQHVERSGDFNFGLGGGASTFSNNGNTETYSLGFSPSWELDIFGRARTARRGVNADFAATRFNIEASRMSLAAQVAQSLFQARALAVQLDDARETVRIRGESARVGAVRAERGIGSRSDAERLNADLAAAEAEARRLDAALNASKRTLLVLLGRGAEPIANLPIEARADAPPSAPATTPGELLQRRPDVREAEQRLRAQAASVAVARLELFPRFTLNGSGSISRSVGATDSTTKLWSVGVSAVAPVLDRPRLMAELRAEKARGEQAVIAYEQAVQTAYGEAENALNTLKADQDRLAQLEKAEASARFAFEAARKGYQAGLIDVTSLLDSERGWRAARAALNGGRAQALQDAVAAFKALGGGWTPPPLQTASADRTR